MFNHVIGNLNSEQLFWAWSENPKLKHLGLQNLSHTQHNTFLTQKGFTSLSGVLRKSECSLYWGIGTIK